MVAKFSGAECVIGVDVARERLSRQADGDRCGPDPKEVSVVDEINKITKGFGADIWWSEPTGNKNVVNDASKNLRRGGDMVLVGLYSGSVEWDLVNNVIYKEANVFGVTGRIMWDSWWTAQESCSRERWT